MSNIDRQGAANTPALHFTQYSRKDFREENTTVGMHHIMAKMTNAGKLLGSTGGALVA
ncbi:MAG: hypothetical protein LQ346_003917 [Caloplaca aetnensis]|nr:MAG: hypothetical protein LQ346_003917 [Caloplaca aetnensis]